MPVTTHPTYVDLLTAFANTLSLDDGTDALSTRSDLTRWLHDQGLLPRRTPSTDDDLALARRLRTGIRDLLAAHQRGETAGSPDLDAASAVLPLRMRCEDTPGLEPMEGGVRGALARILVAVNDAVVGQDWERLKICSDETCRWAYLDTTKNRSKSWCGPSCGNKAKTRSYRERHRTR